MVVHPLLEIDDAIVKKFPAYRVLASVEVGCIFGSTAIWTFVFDGLVTLFPHVPLD